MKEGEVQTDGILLKVVPVVNHLSCTCIQRQKKRCLEHTVVGIGQREGFSSSQIALGSISEMYWAKLPGLLLVKGS